MTAILCQWLNDEVRLDPKIAAEDAAFAEKFSSGYLFGQILYKHDLQSDFCLFSKGTTSEAKLNNFTRLEPTFKLLGVPFSVIVARDVMTAAPGAAIQLMYQLFMALNRKTERQMTTQSLECMKPAGRVRLEKIETEIFQERLKSQTPRQVDINFEGLMEKFKEQKRLYDEKMDKLRKEEEKRAFLEKMDKCHRSMVNSRLIRERRSLMYTKLKPLSDVKRAQSSPGGIERETPSKEASKNSILAEETIKSIYLFENALKNRPNLPPILATPPVTPSTTSHRPSLPETESEDYLSLLHKRVADSNQARLEREKRRRRVLVEHMKALQEQEEQKREKLLVERLMRQCQQERRITTQLMHIRKEKDTIRNNRILRQKQYAEQKEREFHQAMEREAGLALLEEKEKRERLKHHRKMYRKNMAEKAERNYQMNYYMCQRIVLQILDLATKMAHYKELTKGLVPAKIVRDWKTLFVSGRSLYDSSFVDMVEGDVGMGMDLNSSSITRSSLNTQHERSNDQLLNDVDFQEYKDAVSEWSPPPDELSGPLPDPPNPILVHIVYRLLDLVDPPRPPPSPPYMPHQLVRACIVGKPFTGKTSLLKHLKEAFGVHVFSIEDFVTKAVETYLAEKKALDEGLQATYGSEQEETEDPLSPSEEVESTPPIPLQPSSSVDLLVGSQDNANERGRVKVHDSSTSDKKRGKEGVAQDSRTSVQGRGREGVVSSSERTTTGPTPSAEGTSAKKIISIEEQKERGSGEVGGDQEEGGGEEEQVGEEKKDKEVGGSEISKDSPVIILPLSNLAQLGYKAYTAIANGEAVEDSVLIDIFIEEVRVLPEGIGWILDNFPTTVNQAKLLVEAMADPLSPKPTRSREFELIDSKGNSGKKLESACGIDVVLHLSANTEAVLERTSSQDESVSQSSKLEQVQHRILAYAENWPPLRRWCSKFRVLTNINANQDLESVFSAATQIIQEVINKNKQADAMKKLGYGEDLLLSSGSVVSLTSSSSPSKANISGRQKAKSMPNPNNTFNRPSSAELTSPGIQKGNRKWVKAESPLRHALRSSDKDSTTNPRRKSTWSPVNHEATPGTPEWEYYAEPVAPPMVPCLADKWPAIEKTFISTLKQVFQMLREERECICQYFFLRRKEFSSYLCRPDHKQEFITQWQANYNTLEPHLRTEDLMKAELHHRVDDLVDKLWDICERRKEQSMEEQKRIAEEQWLEDHIGLISNHFISIMQAEVDRFQDTMLLFKDYYASMEDKTPEKLHEVLRVALIDLPPTEPQDPPSSQTGSMANVAPASSHAHSTGPNEREGKEEETNSAHAIKKRVPLVPRQPPGDPAEENKKKKTAASSTGSSFVTGVMEGMGLDQKLIIHAFNTATTTTNIMASSEVKILDSVIAEAKKPPKPKTPPPEPKEEKPGKGKKGKGAGSPAGKKRGKTPPKKAAVVEPPPPEPPKPAMTADEVMNKQRKIQMCKEFKEAVQIEENRVKVRLELIRVRALSQVAMLNSTGSAMQAEMDEWVEECYKHEMESVEHLADVLRQAIENEQKLLNEICLPGAKFHIRESIITFVPSPPPSPLPAVEQPDPSYFTVEQLRFLHQQLHAASPSGWLLLRALVDTLHAMIQRSSKRDALPQLWRNASKAQLESLTEQLYGVESTYVDWHQLLLCAALPFPWPLPTAQDLLEAWQALVQDRNTVGRKMVDKERFMSTELWLDKPPEYKEEALFDVFCESSGLLDVHHLLLHLCADPSPRTGLFKALSLVTGEIILPHQEVESHVTILLEDFHKVLTLRSSSEPASEPSMSELLEIFVHVDPTNPNEVSLAALLKHKKVTALIRSATPKYALSDLTCHLKPGCAIPEGISIH